MLRSSLELAFLILCASLTLCQGHNPPRLCHATWAALSEHYVDRCNYSDKEWDRRRLKWERRFRQLDSTDQRANHALVRELLGELSPHMDILSPREVSTFHKEVSGVLGPSVMLEVPAKRRLSNFEQVRIKEFTALTQQELIKSLEGSSRTEISGVTLDLRGNDGGQLNAAVNVAALFLPPGTVVAQMSFGGPKFNHVLATSSARAPKNLQSIPLVVLTDEETASAAEVFAGAVRDHCRGIVVGEYSGHHRWKLWVGFFSRKSRTWGKGTVQTPITLNDAGESSVAILISSARLQTPAGGRIDGSGLWLEHSAVLDNLGSERMPFSPARLIQRCAKRSRASPRTGEDIRMGLLSRLKLCQPLLL